MIILENLKSKSQSPKVPYRRHLEGQSPECSAICRQLAPILKSIYQKHDYHEFGGAPLLGANGNCIICHGSSEAHTMRNAIVAAIKIVNHKINDMIMKSIVNDEVEA